MPFFSDEENEGFGGGEYDNEGENAQKGYSPDTYERLKLTRESRRLAVTQKQKYDSQRECLRLQIQLAEAKLKIETERRKRAEAQRERARQERKLERDKKLTEEEGRKHAETKLQAALAIRDAHAKLKLYADACQDKHDKEMFEAEARKLDAEFGEFLTCSECGGDMGKSEDGQGRICSVCSHRIDW